jgi:hypothetical protein
MVRATYIGQAVQYDVNTERLCPEQNTTCYCSRRRCSVFFGSNGDVFKEKAMHSTVVLLKDRKGVALTNITAHVVASLLLASSHDALYKKNYMVTNEIVD